MAKFTRDTLDAIRSRITLSDIVRPSVPTLKRKGRDWWGCCPFHHEKSPSFHVRDDQGYYHCFGCGAHGNVFDFVAETRGGHFGEAVEHLAGIAGVKLQKENVDPAQERRRNDGMYALERAAVHYERNLTPEAHTYLKRRGLDDAVIKEFRLGWAADSWTGLYDALKSENIGNAAMQAAGLTMPSKDPSKGDYDRFRGRVMFPIEDTKGHVVAFGGRILDAGEPKYLNSPESDFFNKRYVLYNLNRAREHMRREGTAIMVEGYMDVVGLWQHGVQTAVAPLGTAVTEDQVRLLWRYHDAPVVCMDGDLAGRNAARRLARRVMSVVEPGKTVHFMWMPEGDDPDSFVAEHGKEAFYALLKTAQSLEDVLWDDLVEEVDIKSAEGRAQVEKEVMALAATITNETIKKAYTQALKDRMWQAIRGGRSAAKKQVEAPLIRGTRDEQARILLSILFRKPELVEEVEEKFSTLHFEKQEFNAFKSTLFRLYVNAGVEKKTLDDYLVSIGAFEETSRLLQSPLVAEKEESQLYRYWLDMYADYMNAQEKGDVLKSLSDHQTRDEKEKSLEDVWRQFKAKHTQQGASERGE